MQISLSIVANKIDPHLSLKNWWLYKSLALHTTSAHPDFHVFCFLQYILDLASNDYNFVITWQLCTWFNSDIGYFEGMVKSIQQQDQFVFLLLHLDWIWLLLLMLFNSKRSGLLLIKTTFYLSDVVVIETYIGHVKES